MGHDRQLTAEPPVLMPTSALHDTKVGNRVVDVHSHFLPDVYRELALAAGLLHPDGMPALPQWSVPRALSWMDTQGIETSVLSVSSPGASFLPPPQRPDLCRNVNDAARDVVEAHPDRFGYFITLPLPDIDAALTELSRCLSHGDADGVVLLTRYDDVYVSAPAMRPLWARLEELGCTVFLHPTAPSHTPALSVACAPPMYDFLIESTRVVVDLVLSGAISRSSRCRLIVAHGGAMLPAVVERIGGLAPLLTPTAPGAHDFVETVIGLHYDLAGFVTGMQLPSLLAVAQPDHLLFGTDWPFTPDHIAIRNGNLLRSDVALTDLPSLWSGHAALKLLPALARRVTETATRPIPAVVTR